MEIRIGVTDSSKEISLDIQEDVDSLIRRVEESLAQPTNMIWFVDEKGKRVGVPAGKVTYVEIDPESVPRSVGFRP